jgi:hypothetical protein
LMPPRSSRPLHAPGRSSRTTESHLGQTPVRQRCASQPRNSRIQPITTGQDLALQSVFRYVSERSLNSVSLLSRYVKASLKEQVGRCKSALVSSGARIHRAELDHMLKRAGMRAYRRQPDFFTH